MNILKSTLLLVFFCSVSYTRAQEDFKPLQCSGKIPKEFVQLSSVKTAEQIALEKKEHKAGYSENKKKEEFIESSTYILDEMLLSGRILFNDPLSDYVNNILETIIADDKATADKVSLYVLRSDEVNAFATNQGIIFMTTGLLAEVENEAQLAYILGHELTHYKRRHVINSYLENDRIFSSRTRYTTYDDKIRSASTYSKDLELEADHEGIKLIAKTNYDVNEAANSMDVLQFSDLPFDEIEFDPSFLGSEFLKFPSSIILDTVKRIDFFNDDFDDSKSSHPNIKKRREMILAQIAGLEAQPNPVKFIQSEKKFEEIQKMARYETIRYLLNERRYTEAFYEIYVLDKKHPGSAYLEKSYSKALYGMAKYKLAKKYFKTAPGFEKSEGEIQRCFYFFEELSSEELMYVACRNLYLNKVKYNDPFLSKLTDDLFIDLINKYTVNLDDLKESCRQMSEKKEEPVVVDTVDTAKENSGGSKYDKLRQQKLDPVAKKEQNENEFHKKAFCDLCEDEKFKAYFSQAESDASAKKKKQEEIAAKNDYKTRAREEKNRKRKGVALGIKKIVFVDPFYFAMDRSQDVKIKSTEQKLVTFSSDLKQVSENVGLESDMLAPKLFTEEDVQAYNEMSTMNFWISERLGHDDMDIIPLESEYAESVSAKHGSKYFLYSGIISFKEKRDNILGSILLIALVYTSPIGVYNLVRPNEYTYYYSLLFDVTNGDCVLSEFLEFNMKDNRQFLKSQMYDQMLQIKKEKKP